MFSRKTPEASRLQSTLNCQTKDLVIRSAQIINADIEFVRRFVVKINGIPQRQEREADMHLRIDLRSAEGKTMTFSVPATRIQATEFNPAVAWATLDGLLQSAFEFFGVRSLSKLNGRMVRVLTTEDEIWCIGDYLQDRWFTRIGDQSNCEEKMFFHSLQSDGFALLPDKNGTMFRLREVLVPGYDTARIKMATLVPGPNNAMEVVLKLTDIAIGSRSRPRADLEEIVVRFRPSTMEQLTELLNKLCEVSGVAPGNFERLANRLVRFHGEPLGDVSFSGAEREAARHFYIKHPVKAHYVDMAYYNGVKETA